MDFTINSLVPGGFLFYLTKFTIYLFIQLFIRLSKYLYRYTLDFVHSDWEGALVRQAASQGVAFAENELTTRRMRITKQAGSSDDDVSSQEMVVSRRSRRIKN